MFKFIHAADIHLDSPLRGLSRHESAPVEAIRGACRKAFENLVDRAIEEKVSFVLLAGDIYDGDWKDYSTGIFLSHQVGRLGKHNIKVFAVAGNHDAANRMTKALDSPANMQILSSRRAETVKLDDLELAIHGRSFGTQHIHDNLASGFPDAEKGLFNIGLLHTSLDGREGHAPYAPCSVDDLCVKGYHYWALGHVHQQEFVLRDPWIVFPGCIQGRHSRETGAKGCVLVTVEDGSISEVETVPLDVVRWANCRIGLHDMADMPAIMACIRSAIADELASAEGRIVAMRIRLEGASHLADRLSAYPEQLEQQIKALGAELAGDDVWIERVENAVTGKLDMATALADDGVLKDLLGTILAIPDHPDEIEGLQDIITELRQKLPSEVLELETPLDMNNGQVTGRLINEAKHMLIGRLLTVGGIQ
ncbi:metallophosphoesterase family protein [Thiothrix nivea]|uniref:Metallophosphoesterase n=1 Tax=Thiothrix nivea (strain ATCC 35100 / DSM 5205 / JP2) TaxID=870187 RepID=A0A656HHW5_THINJ|nr:DNA repair exonuclease [Thiothrix nivea]EIJ34809.1 metallophosphoesterase [Thiothrix nivea DSM 5205]